MRNSLELWSSEVPGSTRQHTARSQWYALELTRISETGVCRVRFRVYWRTKQEWCKMVMCGGCGFSYFLSHLSREHRERAGAPGRDTPETKTFCETFCRLEGGTAFNVYPAVRYKAYRISGIARGARARPGQRAHTSHETLTALHTTGSTAPRGRLRCGCSELLRLLFTSSDFTHTHITHSHSILASFAHARHLHPHTPTPSPSSSPPERVAFNSCLA